MVVFAQRPEILPFEHEITAILDRNNMVDEIRKRVTPLLLAPLAEWVTLSISD